MPDKDYFSFNPEPSHDEALFVHAQQLLKQQQPQNQQAGNKSRMRSSSGSNLSPRSYSPGRDALPLKSSGLNTPNYLRSPSLMSNRSPVNTLKVASTAPPSKQNTTNLSLSTSSSAKSSRKPSISGPSTSNNATVSGNKSSSPASKTRSNSLSSTKLYNLPIDNNCSTPTLVLPPNLASLNSHSTSSVPLQQVPSGTSTSFQPTVHSIDPTSSSSSTRSANNSATSTLRSFKPIQKQYVLNEQLYLSKMKNNKADDYYTRGIAPSMNDDDDDDDDDDAAEIEADDLENDDSENAFGTNFFTTTEKGGALPFDDDLVTMSSKYLINRLDWLKQTDLDKSNIEASIAFLQKTDAGNSVQTVSSGSSTDDVQTALDRLSQNSLALERLEWQTMLSNVLRGDIVKSEKTKLAKQRRQSGYSSQYGDELWLELKSWMNGRSVEEQKKSLQYLRDSTDCLFEEILSLKFTGDTNIAEAQGILGPLISRYYKVTSYWKNMQHMYEEKPITTTDEFKQRIAAMNAWLTMTNAFESEIEALKTWTANDDLDVKFTTNFYGIEGIYKNERSFAEQILKEKDIESIFQKKIFFRHAPWILKAKVSYLSLEHTLKDINLPAWDNQLETLLTFPMRLVKEIIKIRLDYAKKLKNPTMMMIDQMIDDFGTYIKLSVQIKHTIEVYCSDWHFETTIDNDFGTTVIEATRYLFRLLHLKLLDSARKSFKTFKEPDELIKYWDQLKNVGCYIDGAGMEIAEGFVQLTFKLLNRLHAYILREQNNPPKFDSEADVERWLIQAMENVGSMKRKMNRFSNVLTKAFQNSVNYKVNDNKALLKRLKETGHFLIYTGGELERNGFYLFGSEELLGCSDEEILKILRNTEIGSDLVPSMEIKNSLTVYNALENGWDPNSLIVQEDGANGISYYHIQSEIDQRDRTRSNFRFRKGNAGYQNDYLEPYNNEENEFFELELKLKSLGYVLAVCPAEPMLWEGEMFNLSDDKVLIMDDFKLKTSPETLVLLNQGSTYAMEYQCDKFQHFVGDSVSFNERRCSISAVEDTLQKVNKAYFRMTYSVLSNYPKILNTVQKQYPGCETLNNGFIFCRDFAKNFLRLNVATYEKKSAIIMLMLKISIGWVTFLVDDCDPTDPRTFRWCVPAMEFAMQMTSSWNILGLDEKQFAKLKQKISGCMSLLISHFDIMGARSLEAEKNKSIPQVRPNIDVYEDDDDAILEINSALRLEAITELENATKGNRRHVGKVLDDTDKDNKYLLSLASSISNVSIRWQKRNFIGGGTFGTVFSAVNLDTGDILAVKEIKIQDSKSMQQVFPSIKDEMTVLEMLNHPNIVQYYGVEVHRDKVNIFMEYCEGGSLANLLEHGRVEDEMVTQVYALQLLEGLAYLHQSGVVHRDIKPENILLDFNGIIKYVDFGAAKLLAKNSTKGNIDATSSEAKQERINTMMGTPMYMSPESITGTIKGKFGSDDIWSLGCVILEMVTGRRPWANLDNEWAIMYHVAAGHAPQFPARDEISRAGRKFLSRCLIQDPNKRATAVELLMDPWIAEIRKIAFGDSEGVDADGFNTAE